ncbi:hypothetical protein [Paludifilum halophilum]|uniref:Uncharacterized protein n=1 Tax=Paludifilum halophilum TaxID=1642702 RepID=A0A235B9T5_9BACL|nr:hypothetical protein [Paludifilum halophilum]OYD08992.1 hypothetical protein CHM34_04250 [Paludifilum halophilum]
MLKQIDLRLDWKSMGILAYVPVAVVALLTGYYTIDPPHDIFYVIRTLEMSVPVFASWWSIFLMQEYVEGVGGETLFSYPLHRWKMGTLRILIFWMLYLSIVAVLLGWVQFLMPDTDLFFSLLIELGIQSFFFAGLGFLFIVVTKNTSWSMGLVIVYTSTLLTGGNLIPVSNIFVFRDEPPSLDQILSPAIKPLLFGILCWVIAQWRLGRGWS